MKSYLDNIEISQHTRKKLETIVIAMDYGELITQKKHIEKYTYFQNQSYKVADLINDNIMFTDSDRVAIGTCGDYLSFGVTDNDEIRLVASNFCRKRYCPMCQWRKSEKQYSNCLKLSQELNSHGYKFIHLVLTVPNCEGGVVLQDTIKQMNKAFALFIRMKEIKRAFKGILRCLEISYNYETHLFHPHFHCLVAVKASYFNNPKHYVKYDTVRELWSKAYKSDRLLQVSLGAIKGEDTLGFAEVSKYCLKPLEFEKGTDVENAYILYTLAYSLKGLRFTQTYGVIKSELAKIKEENKSSERVETFKQMYEFVWNYRYHKYERMED